eukprot:scaffold108799_cov19-Tisochrysis_lutea.AAC.1
MTATEPRRSSGHGADPGHEVPPAPAHHSADRQQQVINTTQTCNIPVAEGNVASDTEEMAKPVLPDTE